MPKAYIDPDKCQRCSQCPPARICPPKAIFKIDAEETAVVDLELCHGCGDCVAKCETGAVVLRGK